MTTLEEFRAEMARNVRQMTMRVKVFEDYTCAVRVGGFTGDRVVRAEWIEEAHVPGTRRRLGECTVTISSKTAYAAPPFVDPDDTTYVRKDMGLRIYMVVGGASGYEQLCGTYLIDSVESCPEGVTVHGTDVMSVLDIPFRKYLSLRAGDVWHGMTVPSAPSASSASFGSGRKPATVIRDRVESLGMARAMIPYDRNANGTSGLTWTAPDDATLCDAIMQIGPYYGADLVQQRDGSLKWQTQSDQAVETPETAVYGWGDAVRSSVLSGAVYRDPCDPSFAYSPAGLEDLSDPLEVDAVFLSILAAPSGAPLATPFLR